MDRHKQPDSRRDTGDNITSLSVVITSTLVSKIQCCEHAIESMHFGASQRVASSDYGSK